jgi:hypothetical protein
MGNKDLESLRQAISCFVGLVVYTVWRVICMKKVIRLLYKIRYPLRT